MWEHGGKEEVRLKGGAEMNTSYCRVPRERDDNGLYYCARQLWRLQKLSGF